MADAKIKLSRVPRHWTLAQRLAYYSAPPNENGCVIWTGFIRPDGYGEMYWRGHARAVHRLSWEVDNGPIPAGGVICHHCDMPACRAGSHLFLGTHADNMADKVAKGRQHRGERVPASKLTAEMVLAIRMTFEAQHRTAARFGVSQQTVSDIKRGKMWKHVLILPPPLPASPP